MLAVQASLTPRDLVLLGWLEDHGVLTSEQIAAGLFPSRDFAQRRLVRLYRLGVLARFRPQKWDGGGTYPYHYVLSQVGVEVVAAQRGTEPPRKDRARARRLHLTSRANLPHLLGVNQFFIDLAGWARTHPGAELTRWWPGARFHDQTPYYELFPHENYEFGSRPRPRPDGHGIWTETRDGIRRQCSFWLEHDEGTESLPVLIGKTTRYADLAYGTGAWWPVLFWLPTARRESNLHHALTEEAVRIPIATAARDWARHQQLNPAEAIWRLHPAGGQRRRLGELPVTHPKQP